MYKPRWYQEEAEFSIFDYFTKSNGNPVVALPTGTGKSIVIGSFLQNVFRSWPNQRIMMLTHVKELITQNAQKLVNIWPNAPLGIYSAGLKLREMQMPIVFGGIQSVSKAVKKAVGENGNIAYSNRHFGHRDLVLIDECHLLGPSDTTMYQYTIAELRKINPYIKIIGFTATPYRMKQGMITDEGLFTDICYDMTDVDGFNRLIAEGFISPLIPKRTNIEIDVSNVGLMNGDYNSKELAAAVDKDEITYKAVQECCEQGINRRSWLIFATSVENAEHVAAMFQSFGIACAATHSKLSSAENDKRIVDFKMGRLRALVNNNKLTTGFDYPPIDLIGMLRPTLSPGLWVQMLGRGSRPSEETGKVNCLVLDFAGNTKRLGPINDPLKPRKPGKGTPGEVPIKLCKHCGAYNHASARVCACCGIEFDITSKLFETASTSELLRSDAPIVQYFPVDRVLYNLHSKSSSPPSIRVSYISGLNMYSEWICLEHPGFPGKRAREWWRQRHFQEPPNSTYEALQRTRELRVPRRIRVWINKKYPEVLSYEY